MERLKFEAYILWLRIRSFVRYKILRRPNRVRAAMARHAARASEREVSDGINFKISSAAAGGTIEELSKLDLPVAGKRHDVVPPKGGE